MQPASPLPVQPQQVPNHNPKGKKAATDVSNALLVGRVKPIRALILLPTRELAMQVLEATSKIVPMESDAVLVCGGLQRALNWISAPWTRLVVAILAVLRDYLKRGEISLKNVEMLVWMKSMHARYGFCLLSGALWDRCRRHGRRCLLRNAGCECGEIVRRLCEQALRSSRNDIEGRTSVWSCVPLCDADQKLSLLDKM